jgi:hypothetical protein
LADNQGKQSFSRAQGSRHRAHALTKPAVKAQKLKSRPHATGKAGERAKHAAKPRDSTRSRAKTKRETVPPSLRYKETKRGKTTIRRYPGRTFYFFEEARGKPLDRIEFFTSGNYHCIDVKFEDKTTFHFVIDPTFTLEASYSDWKTGNWRPIKRWPVIASESPAG